jgi:hypothetical protein
MQELLAVLVTWISVATGMPAVDDHPRVVRASSAEMIALRLDRAAPELARNAEVQVAVTASPAHHADLHAVYDDQTQTIYLEHGWTGATPAESSILVHELVHHLQNVAGLTYACAEAREKPAYQAQARWLELFDTSLEQEFELDPMTLLVRSNCMH